MRLRRQARIRSSYARSPFKLMRSIEACEGSIVVVVVVMVAVLVVVIVSIYIVVAVVVIFVQDCNYNSTLYRSIYL